MQVSYETVYLTGAPAAGKSTVVSHLSKIVPDLLTWDYGERLRQHVEGKLGRPTSYEEIRKNPRELVTPDDVAQVDAGLVAWTGQHRATSHLLIDTHAVTREEFGFRVTPFSSVQLATIAPTRIVVLYCAPDVAVARIEQRAMGRTAVSSFEAGFHTALQASVAIAYSVSLGVPTYYVDGGQEIGRVVSVVRRVGFRVEDLNLQTSTSALHT